jgi:hypothetical protein
MATWGGIPLNSTDDVDLASARSTTRCRPDPKAKGEVTRNVSHSPFRGGHDGGAHARNRSHDVGLRKGLWAGRTLSALVVVFLIFDGVTKLMKVTQVVEATAQLGFRESSIPVIGLLLLACTLVYVIPRPAVLGAILLTGYLGGATAANVRVGHPLFETVFPVLFGVLIWAGLILREDRLRTLLPSRR